MLPPTIGSAASLNLAIAFVGDPGNGKSSLLGVSAELLGVNQSPIERGVGSGEGLIESFLVKLTVPDPNDPKKSLTVKVMADPPARIFDVDEIEHLGGVGARSGSTILPILRTALMGGALKTSNATEDRTRSVERHSYRLVLVVMVQPELSHHLLNGANSGMPQRFVWVETTDPTTPDEKPEWPGEIDWSPSALELMEPQEIDYPDHIKAEIDEHQRRVQRQEDVDPMEGHLRLTRLKVAAALAFLHGEFAITDRWWDLSGRVMEWSAEAQERCRSALAAAGSRRNAAKGRSLAEVEEASDAHKLEAARRALLAVVKRHPDGVSKNAARRALSHSHRAYVDKAVSDLDAAGLIRVEGAKQGGSRLWPTTLA